MKNLGFILASLFSLSLFSQQQVDLNKTVFLDAVVDKTNQTITLSWDLYPNTMTHFIYRREVGEANWGSEIATLEGTVSSYVDQADIGQLYEYRVFRFVSGAAANGYIYAGIEVDEDIFNRHLILVSESDISIALEDEIEAYKDVVRQAGWTISHHVVNKTYLVSELKDDIVNMYHVEDISKCRVFLLGHVPVPYSGDLVPDGHGNHIGAWPADGFYGDIDGIWTDETVNNVSGSSNRTHNIPGDEKYDQSIFPSSLELAVGRADFSDLPAFEDDEIELTRQYLNKNIMFRQNQILTKRQGVVENNFNLVEGFGQNGYKNIAALVGRDSVIAGDYSTIYSESLMWSYGAGGGNYQGASGIGNTSDFANTPLQTIFTMLFGSYFGDWDVQNNFLRAALASGTTLSNAWAGRPNWYFHPMGMGADLGHCTLLSMNNSNYDPGFAARNVHMALMGDPTLEMDYVVADLSLTVNEMDGHAALSWISTGEDAVDAFYVYRSTADEQEQLLTRLDGETFSYVDSCLQFGQTYQYMLTAAKLHEGATGSYFNQSNYVEDSVTIETESVLEADFLVEENYNLTIELSNTSIGADSLVWDFGDGNISLDSDPIHVYDSMGDYIVSLTIFNACGSETITDTISIGLSNIETPSLAVSIGPNPVIDDLKIDFENLVSDLRLKVFDVFGQLVGTVDLMSNITLNVSEYTPGVYQIQFFEKKQSEDLIHSVKFIKLER